MTGSIGVALPALDATDPRVSDRRATTERLATEFEDAWAGDVIGWAAAVVPRFAVTSSFGADSPVLLHLLSMTAPDVPVLFLDTGLHLDATLSFRLALADRLGLRVVDVTPARTPAEQAADHGAQLWERDPDRCCALRKTEPLDRAIDGFDGWASGVRRDQTPERARTPVVELRRAGDRYVTKVAPLARWSAADVATYLDAHDLPRHPLLARGYTSIGCAPCTGPVGPGDDPRAGRWARFDTKTECGIHLTGDDPASTAG